MMALILAGCDPKYIGRPCDLGLSDDGGTGASATVSGQVLACPTGICLLPAKAATVPNQGTGPYCSDDCASNDDCSGGLEDLRGSAPDDRRCKKGFACGVATEVGEFCCRRLCICLDFVDTSVNGVHLPTPAACLPGSGSSCRSVK